MLKHMMTGLFVWMIAAGLTGHVAQSAPSTKPSKRDWTSPGIRHFKRGALSEAATTLRQEGRRDLADKVRDFRDTYRKGRKAYIKRKLKAGVGLLHRALDLDRQLCNNTSIFTRQLRMMLANLHFGLGNRAMNRRQTRDYAAAYQHFSRSVGYYPRQYQSKQGLKRLRRMAKSWLQSAKALGNKAKARRLLRQLKQVVSPKDILYKQADRMLNR